MSSSSSVTRSGIGGRSWRRPRRGNGSRLDPPPPSGSRRKTLSFVRMPRPSSRFTSSWLPTSNKPSGRETNHSWIACLTWLRRSTGSALVSVEDYSGFDVKPIDAPRCHIRRADVRDFSTAAVAKVNRLWVVEPVSVAHDSKKGVRTRKPENIDQLMHCGGLGLSVIGTN